MMHEGIAYRFSGRTFTVQELALIREVVETCAGVSRKELANHGDVDTLLPGRLAAGVRHVRERRCEGQQAHAGKSAIVRSP